MTSTAARVQRIGLFAMLRQNPKAPLMFLVSVSRFYLSKSDAMLNLLPGCLLGICITLKKKWLFQKFPIHESRRVEAIAFNDENGKNSSPWIFSPTCSRFAMDLPLSASGIG
jgi:hypothetical protein